VFGSTERAHHAQAVVDRAPNTIVRERREVGAQRRIKSLRCLDETCHTITNKIVGFDIGRQGSLHLLRDAYYVFRILFYQLFLAKSYTHELPAYKNANSSQRHIRNAYFWGNVPEFFKKRIFKCLVRRHSRG